MAISKRLQAYLKERDMKYRLIRHAHTGSSMESAEQAHIPGSALAKGIVARAGAEYLMAVVPSDYHVDFDSLAGYLGTPLTMATEDEIASKLPDCERGAIPPLGYLYGMRTLWDPNTKLGEDEKVYFEAGDHEHLVQVSGEHFHELMTAAERASFSRHI